jgi:hypothetical protein
VEESASAESSGRAGEAAPPSSPCLLASSPPTARLRPCPTPPVTAADDPPRASPSTAETAVAKICCISLIRPAPARPRPSLAPPVAAAAVPSRAGPSPAAPDASVRRCRGSAPRQPVSSLARLTSTRRHRCRHPNGPPKLLGLAAPSPAPRIRGRGGAPLASADDWGGGETRIGEEEGRGLDRGFGCLDLGFHCPADGDGR